MNFIIEQYNNRSYLTYPLSEKGCTDPLLMGMLLNNRIPGFGEFSTRDVGKSQRLCYDIHGLHSMKDIFTETIPRHILLNTFDRILAALDAAQDYMIEESCVVMDPQYIFLDPSTFRMALICLPLMDYRNGNDMKSFFKSIMFNTIFDYNEPCDHVARIMNYLNGPDFSPADFRSLLRELGAKEASAEEPPAPEQDPFFAFDTLSQSEQSSEVQFSFTEENTHKTPLQEADDILSAALLHSDPSADRTAKTAQPAPVVSRSSSHGEEAPVSTASDPLSIAEQLLSAALAGDPIPQEEAPVPSKEAPAISAPSSEEGDSSVRSRRSRARREAREPQPVSRTTPVQEASKESAPAGSDPLDFLDGFAPSVSANKTDAMKAADAILSALDLPTKEAKEAPGADLFADLIPVTSEGSVHPAEDSFSDFTTPIVSSRRKSGTTAPVKAPEPRKAAPAPAPPGKPNGTEEPFDFFTSTKDTVAPTEAMKIADELLSAALAGIPPQEPAEPTKKDTFTTTAPTVSKKTEEEDISLSLDFFSSSPSKKTAAMLEAEAILDSLDLYAPSQEGAYSSVPAEAPTPKTAEPLPRTGSSAQQEPVRKGGFFSKLRKKENAPTTVPQTPPQPVVPYFGSDGETTVLNVSQQMTMPEAPYLVRSSNGETVVLSKAVFRVGKDRDFVDYCISDNSAISRRHANFMVRNGDVFIIDTNSTNHTYVNGVMIRSNTEVKLTHGDEIRLANEDFMLYCAGTL